MTVGVIHSTINSGLKSRKFHVLNETCHSFFIYLKISRIFFVAFSCQLIPWWWFLKLRTIPQSFVKFTIHSMSFDIFDK